MSKPVIIYEDDHLLLVEKAAGLLTIPDRYDTSKPNLLHQLQAIQDAVFTVHRLDRETSGIICFAKTEAAHRHLSMQFQERSVQKLYLAIVEGVPPTDSGVINAPLSRTTSGRNKMRVQKDGKTSITHWKIIESFQQFALVECDIKTGRMHQIRVHFKHMGYPILCDPLYGRREAFFLSELKKKRYNLGKGQEERPLLSRTALHAASLAFTHPVTSDRLAFSAALPKDMRAVLKQLKKLA